MIPNKDDRLDNLAGAKTNLLFSAYHNLELSDSMLERIGVERMNGWLDVKKRFLKK